MFGFGKKNNPDTETEEKGYEDELVDDLSDEGCSDKPVKFSESRVRAMDDLTEEQPDEHEKTNSQFERRNSNQLDAKGRTGMTTRSNKTLVGTIKRQLKDSFLNLKDAFSGSADEKAKDHKMLQESTTTSQEKNYKGLKKNYIYIAVAAFFLVVALALVFANSDDPNKGNPAANANNMRSSGSGSSGTTQSNPVLLNIPQNYGDTAGDTAKTVKAKESEKLHEDAKTDDRAKKAEKPAEKKQQPQQPQQPQVPPMPEARRQQQPVRDPAVKLKDDALKSDISFRISNSGVKR